jgi:hypothetical protein
MGFGSLKIKSWPSTMPISKSRLSTPDYIMRSGRRKIKEMFSVIMDKENRETK